MPRPEDGPALWECVKSAGTLDLNSQYYYVLLCDFFQQTCCVAAADDKIVGFVLGIIPPRDQRSLFVWQVYVDPIMRGQGLGRSLVRRILERECNRSLRYVLATVTPSNQSSHGLFRRLARELDATVDLTPYYASDVFGPVAHEPEDMYRIGPFHHSHVLGEVSHEYIRPDRV